MCRMLANDEELLTGLTALLKERGKDERLVPFIMSEHKVGVTIQPQTS